MPSETLIHNDWLIVSGRSTATEGVPFPAPEVASGPKADHKSSGKPDVNSIVFLT